MMTNTLQRLGNYRLLHRLGTGGFAEVYLGEHVYLKTHAAIKVLRTQLSSQDIQQFIKEAQIIALLNHPHILRVLDFGVDDTIPFLVMDYAPHGTLREVCPRGHRMPLPTILSYVKQVASALQYAHANNVIHRDVKPENMLLGRNNEVMLSDFGIAVAAHRTSSLKTLDTAGTPHYMAPEHIRGKPRPASDQYALGLVVYEWLCGTRPFHGDILQVMYQQANTAPPPLRKTVPTLSPDIEQVVLQALAKDPHQRFVSIEAFAKALEDAHQRSLRENMQRCMYRGHVSSVTALAWSSDGTHIATADYHEQMHIWKSMTGVPCSVDSHADIPGPVGGIAWSPDGMYLAFGNRSAAAVIRSLVTGEERVLDDLCGNVDVMAWSPNGSRLASGSVGKVYGDTQVYIVQIWDTLTEESIFTHYLYLPLVKGRSWFSLAKGGFVSMRWLPDNTGMTFVNLDKTVETWDTTTQKRLFAQDAHSHRAAACAVALSPDGKSLASLMADQTVEVSEAISGHILCTYRGHQGLVHVVAWSPDSKYIASSSTDAAVHVWDAKTGQHVYTYQGHTSRVNVLAWSPDGRHVASASSDRTVHTWQVQGL
ncbi:MAG: protein kinase [Ktedonobacteraceae bacterium]|nr:protein kinase [Ktedonobacteraceae bacterium]